jgi:phosphodiesterase/alkaline phosphatase D-like protein
MVTAHAQPLSGLTMNTTYNYRVRSTNALGLTAVSNNSTFKTLATPAAISNVVASPIDITTAVISWTTDLPADTQIEYGLTSAYGTLTTLNTALVTSHVQALSALTANTEYHFRVRSKASGAAVTISPDATFTTLPNAEPAVISNVSSSNVTASGAAIAWLTDVAADTQVEYGTTTEYGSLTTPNTALVTSHLQTLSGLAANTEYHFRVRSKVSGAAVTVSPDATFTTLMTAPAVTLATASGITTTSATITWTTDQPADSLVDLGTTTDYGTTASDATPVLSHTQTLSGLTPSTTYHYRVTSKNAQGTAGSSADLTFTTAAVPAVISSVAASNMTASGATIAWLTDLAADTQVEYGTTTDYGNMSALNGAPVTSHQQTLSGLAANTEYHFRVRSRTTAGALAVSDDATFTTLMTAPVVTLATATAITTTSATITWTTDQPADSLVDLGTTTDYGTTASDATPVLSHTQTLSGLTPSTTYHYRATSRNVQGTAGSSADLTFTTVAVPAVISGVSSSNVTASGATIAWLTDLAADTQVEYGTTTDYGNMSALNGAPVTSHQQALSGLAANTEYHFRARSRTTAGALTVSDDATFTTLMTAPVVTLATATAITTTSATITWTTDQLADSLVDMGLTSGYGTSIQDATPVLLHTQTLSSLTPATTYHYRVTSRNSQGTAGSSVDLTFTTAAPPAVISGVSSSNVTTSGATIAWLTDLAADTQVEYGLTTTYGSSTTLNSSLVTSHQQALSGLSANTLYHFRVRSKTGAGVLTVSDDATFTTMMNAPVVTLTTATAIASTSANITWTTDQPSDSLVQWGLTTAYGSSTQDATLVLAHARTLSGLSPSTLYHYRVTSRNSQGAAGSSADLTFTTAPITAVISAVASSNITTTSARITWLTDLATDTQVEYGTTTNYGSQTTRITTLVTSHSQTISSLTSGTLYHYRVKSRTAAGVTTTSADFTFTTVATPPQLSNIRSTSVTRTTATISWTTNQPATTQVEYGLTTSYGSTTTLNPALLTSHSVPLSGLTPNRTYHYRVKSTNAQGLTTVSGDFTFRTQSGGGGG